MVSVIEHRAIAPLHPRLDAKAANHAIARKRLGNAGHDARDSRTVCRLRGQHTPLDKAREQK